jgi:NADH-quinone oxidoreductase subunit M
VSELRLPWLELLVAIPLVGAVCVGVLRDRAAARQWSLAFCGAAFACGLGAWQDFVWLHASVAHDRWDVVSRLGSDWLVIDALSAPLLPLAALLHLLTVTATLRIKMRRFSFSLTLLSLAIVLATLCCRQPWGIIGLMAAGAVPPYLELRKRRKSSRVYCLHMGLFIVLMVIGWFVVELGDRTAINALWALGAAVCIRSGVAPLHCWVTDLFEHATFGTALLFVTPMLGAYATARLVLPLAPAWMLHSLGIVALASAVYAAGMALVQREARRFFCYIFLSHSALVLVGLKTLSPIGLTGGLSLWLSASLSLAGFGLMLRALEARHGRLSLAIHHGLYAHTPMLAVAFLLTGMASVGFPGTLGFLASELLVDGAVQTYPYFGIGVVIAAALNGIAVVQAYFKLFTGTRHVSAVPLQIGMRERITVLVLAVLILGGGLLPQRAVSWGHRAAMDILHQRGHLRSINLTR